jgi:hypothetical protein
MSKARYLLISQLRLIGVDSDYEAALDIAKR